MKSYLLKYESVDDFEEFLSELSPDEFIKDMESVGELNYVTGDYSIDCSKLCRNSVAWVFKKLMNTFYIFEFEIIEGYFNRLDHCWIKVGNYYLDLTLSQFIEDAPKIAITKIDKNYPYEPIKAYDYFHLKDWLATQ